MLGNLTCNTIFPDEIELTDDEDNDSSETDDVSTAAQECEPSASVSVDAASVSVFPEQVVEHIKDVGRLIHNFLLI